jgi:hypothetical protein
LTGDANTMKGRAQGISVRRERPLWTTSVLSITLPEVLHRKLTAISAETGDSKAETIRRILMREFQLTHNPDEGELD